MSENDLIPNQYTQTITNEPVIEVKDLIREFNGRRVLDEK